MVGGATLVPILVGILGHYTATPILLTLPMMVVVIALLYLNQWNSIMRCGRYIRTRLEPEMLGEEGWEAWLESHPDTHMGAVHNRLVDTYLVYAFYLLTAAYYFACSFIAISYARTSYSPVAAWLALAVYIVIGLTMGYIILERVPTHTTTKRERHLLGEAHAAAQAAPAASEPVTLKVPTGDGTLQARAATKSKTTPGSKGGPAGKASISRAPSAKVIGAVVTPDPAASAATPAPGPAGQVNGANLASRSRRSKKIIQS